MNASVVDMAQFIAPKSDQLNADDLIGGPRTVTVARVSANAGSAEQPVSVSFEGDNGKPYKPCKSMRRVMVHVWGADTRSYPGRSMTLYCDPEVQFGGMKTGGIRISHMSHMAKAQTMALTATRSKRAPFTVQPLDGLFSAYGEVTTAEALAEVEKRRSETWPKLSATDKVALKAISVAAQARITPATSTTAGGAQ